MKRDLNLEGFSVLGRIIDCVALRKLVQDYRPINRRPDKILKYSLINQFGSALVYLFVSAKTKNRQQTFKIKMAAAGEEKSPFIRLGINQPDDMSLLQARKKIS